MNSIVSAARAASTITAGRRAGAPTTLNTATLSSNSPTKDSDELSLGGGASSSAAAAGAGRRAGGAPPATSWGSETTGSTGPVFGQTGTSKVNQRAAAAAATASSGNDDGAVVIRDDAETIDTEADQTKSAAPRNQARRVQSLFELQEQSGSGGLEGRTIATRSGSNGSNSNSGSGLAAGLDLSLLTSVMSPPDALKEPDEVWVYSNLLQKLSQEISNEEDKNEIEDVKLRA